MPVEIHECGCALCQNGEDAPEREAHHRVNVLMSRLDEQQRRWYAAVEAERYGYGGTKLVAQITGLDEKTIRRGKDEMSKELADRPQDRIRVSGGGRPPVEKKTRQ